MERPIDPGPWQPRVLLVTKGLDLGGIERIVVDLALGLGRHGVEVDVAVINAERARLAHLLEAAGVPLHRLDGSDLIGWRASRQLRRLLATGGYDVVHVHGPLPASLVRVVAGRVPIVTTSHTPWHSLHPLTRLAWRFTARRDAAALAVSAGVAESLPPGTQPEVVPHGVDVDRIEAARRAPTESGSGGGATSIVCVASHRDAKNYPNLLRSVRHASDLGAPVRLSAIGDGPNLEAHRRLARQLGIADIVEFEPATEDVLERIAAADLVVVASDYEGQPIVVAEALALGKPVVATAVGRVPELVSPAVGRVVPPRDADALGRALAELALDPELRQALGAAAREHAVGWTLDDVLEIHRAVYHRVSRR